MKSKIHLGKTATSRSRKKKVIEEVISKTKLPQDDFMKWLLIKGYSSKTAERFVSAVIKFNAWLKKEGMGIENAGYNDLTAYLQSFGGVTQKTKSCYLAGVKQYFNFLIQCEERTDNPAAFIRLRGMKRKTLHDLLNRQELDRLYRAYTSPDENEKSCKQNWFKAKLLAQKRNKVILGLILYQALDSRDLKLLRLSDIQLREGMIFIPGTRRSNERELKLEVVQIMDMMEYIQKTRVELLQLTGRYTDQLFISTAGSERFGNIMGYLLGRLRQINSRVRSVQQLKASVIVLWLKQYNLRQVQYMAGHRYVSSTEGFLASEMEQMTGDIEKYHPINENQ